MTVLYTPGQLRSAVSIAPETYRHWKKALAPLRRGRGHSPCFTPGDLIAISIVHTLTMGVAIRIGALSPLANSLFELCNASPWPVLERAKLAIDLGSAHLTLLSDAIEISSSQPLIIVPLGPIIDLLRRQLLAESEPDDQGSLRFPPLAIRATAVANGSRS